MRRPRRLERPKNARLAAGRRLPPPWFMTTRPHLDSHEPAMRGMGGTCRSDPGRPRRSRVRLRRGSVLTPSSFPRPALAVVETARSRIKRNHGGWFGNASERGRHAFVRSCIFICDPSTLSSRPRPYRSVRVNPDGLEGRTCGWRRHVHVFVPPRRRRQGGVRQPRGCFSALSRVPAALAGGDERESVTVDASVASSAWCHHMVVPRFRPPARAMTCRRPSG